MFHFVTFSLESTHTTTSVIIRPTVEIHYGYHTCTIELRMFRFKCEVVGLSSSLIDLYRVFPGGLAQHKFTSSCWQNSLISKEPQTTGISVAKKRVRFVHSTNSTVNFTGEGAVPTKRFMGKPGQSSKQESSFPIWLRPRRTCVPTLD